jgi:glycosyltransferase involved in cell wall biosynthesis
MKVSIFTATHNTRWLGEVYDSIKKQNFDEWVIVYNGGAKPIFSDGVTDKRICEYEPGPLEQRVGSVGWLKKYACSKCTGDILVELDHDDLLMPNAIDLIKNTFYINPEVGFVYSNSVAINMDGSPRPKFNPAHGWRYRDFNYNGKIVDEPITFKPTPASVSRIWYAPDHVRAFRRDVYEAVGGYDADLSILDDQDLMCRMYQITQFYHIDAPLYIYRVHDDNTWLERNQLIQDGVMPMYDKYIEPMALKWAKDQGLLCLDLGGRFNADSNYQSVDRKDADYNTNLNTSWPFEDNSVGVIRANDIFEHLKDQVYTMEEMWRVLAPGGYAFIRVPSTDGRGAFQDPTHVTFWNENSFLYYTHSNWAQYIDTPVRFQAMRLFTTSKDNKGVCWVVAHLVKLDNRADRPPGLIDI